MKEVYTSNCGRENDLIAFLYGESNDVESRTFQRHLRDCSSCNAELAAFRNVRESVVTWRDESLGVMSSPSTESSAARVGPQKPSALAALREFFNLAPLWMKGTVAFASILFCLFAGLAVARLREKPQVVTIANPGNVYSQQEINALVARRVQEELERQNKAEQQPPSRIIVKEAADRFSGRRVANRGSIAFSVPAEKARRPLSKTEREQLAADLRLITAKNDSDLDLLDDRTNE